MPGKKKKSPLKPRTYYEELADIGILRDFLKQNLNDKYENDPEFRDKMLHLLIERAEGPVPEVEARLLEELCESLGFFLEYNSKWMK